MSSTRSLRHQIAEQLRSRIHAGEWRPGDRLPSEPELARSQSVSRSSLRAAIAMLEEEGFVSRRHGSGTYVTHRPVLSNELGRNFGVSSLIAATGMVPGTADETCQLVGAPEKVAAAFGIEIGEPVSALRRVRTADGRRVVVSTDWVRADLFSPDELAELGDGSIYAALAARDLPVHHGVATLTPGFADADTARRLDVPRGSLLLSIEQVDSTVDGVPVLVSLEHHLADAFSFTVLRNGPGTTSEEEP